ncbi:MAG TPA: hypothetical protein VNA15_10360 [Candidatus Angelobacter sp.]|nr:hypothetical protein [Candidatus Angelobacter sp.]
MSIQISPFYLLINAVGLPSTSVFANGLGSFTRIFLFFGFLTLAAASLRPNAWWRNLAVYIGLSSLAELYFSFVMMYYWAESAFVAAYGVVPPYSGTAPLQGRILGLDLAYYSGPLITAAFAIPFYLGFVSFSLVMGRGLVRAIQERALRVLAALLPGGGIHDVYLTPPYQHVWFSSGDKAFNPMITDPDKLNDDELLVSFQKLYDTVEPGGSLSIVLPAWATKVGDRFQRLMPNTGFTIEESGVVYRSPGKPETELRFRKPVQEIQAETPTISAPSEEAISILPPTPPNPLIQSVIESAAPPVLEVAEEPQWIPPKPSRIEKVMVKAAVELISHHQEPVPYRELLNQVYMHLVDKKVDFDSARQIEHTLLDHNGREILLIEESDEANNRVVKKWWLGEQKLVRDRKPRISLVGRISQSRPKLPSVRFPFGRRKSRYVERTTSDED